MTSKKASGQAGPAQRVIKKYPNRRLYDTDTSTYITLAEVKQLVMQSEPFVVRDAKTNEDLTRSILLQIILEEEAGGAPMFSEAALANLIRFYGHAMQGAMGSWFEQNMKAFADMQERVLGGTGAPVPNLMGNYLEKNVQAFTDFQAKLAEQSKTLTPELWAQFMNMQNPMMQGMMGSYAEQSRAMFEKMQEQMQKNTEQMLGAFGIKK